MLLRKELSFPERTGDIERDFDALHDYVYKLRDMLEFNLSNLQSRNFNQILLSKLLADTQIDFNDSKRKDKCSIKAFDNGLFLGTTIKRTEPEYTAREKDSGLFIEFETGKAFTVHNGTMTEIGG